MQNSGVFITDVSSQTKPKQSRGLWVTICSQRIQNFILGRLLLLGGKYINVIRRGK